MTDTTTDRSESLVERLLRLGRSLAGRLLRVEVEAVDVRGSRQLEPEAGAIGVRR